MDPGARLLELIEAKIAAGMDRRAAQAAVFSTNRELVDDWHGAGGPVRETELTVYPGEALLALSTAYERAGLPRERAVRLALDRHPHLAAAHHEGRTIPKPPPRPRLPATRQRQLWSSHDALRPGEVLCHKLADVTAGGGWFALAGV